MRGERALARLVARRADAVVCASHAIAEEMRALQPRGAGASRSGTAATSRTSPGLPYRRADRFRVTHAGSFFGRRDPRPFLDALARADGECVARFVGDFRSADREYAERLRLGDRLELIPYLPRGEVLALQRDSEALLLLIPEAGGRGRGVLSGKVFEYLAAERPMIAAVPPDGEAAALAALDRSRSRRRARTTSTGWADASAELEDRWRAGELDGAPHSPDAPSGSRGAPAPRSSPRLLRGLA